MFSRERCERAKIRLVSPFPFADQAEQEVFGLDRHAAKLAGLVTSEKQHPARAFRVPFEHQACLEVRDGNVEPLVVIIGQTRRRANRPPEISPDAR
jgi:hypothetical protein